MQLGDSFKNERKPTNRISQGKLLTKETAATAFHIDIDDVNKCVSETIQLIKDGKIFAILMPISLSLTSESTTLRQQRKWPPCQRLS
jgi:hypothetical protein